MNTRVVWVTALISVASFSAAAQSAAPAPSDTTRATPICFNFREVMASAVYPPEAIAQGLEKGSALVEFTLTPSGKVTDIRAIESSHPIFAAAAETIASRYQCRGVGNSVQVHVPLQWKLE